MPHYHIYRSFTNDLDKRLRAQLKSQLSGKAIKAMNQKELLTNFTRSIPSFHGSMDSYILSDELFWQRQGCPIIFPESADLVQGLLSAKFDVGQLATLPSPYRSFMVAMPQGALHDGIAIPPFLMSVMSVRETAIDVRSPFFEFVDVPRSVWPEIPSADEKLDKTCVSLAYNDPTSKNVAVIRSTVQADDIPAMLNTTSLEEFERNFFNGSVGELDLPECERINELELRIQMIITRIALALLVYSNALPETLRSGFPGSGKILGKLPDRALGVTLSSAAAASGGTGDKGEHYRAWFFRQLQNARYYQGDHAGKPPGSRWVFVRDTYVKRDVEAATMVSPAG